MKYLLLFMIPVASALAQDSPREKELLDMIQQLEKRVAALERVNAALSPAAPAVTAAVSQQPEAPSVPNPAPPNLIAGTSINFLLDGYYEFNFNDPIGRANLLRAYDVSSNSFSLNQADLVLENTPDPASGKRYGARIDLQWGQATQTLQGSSTNEPRPDIYRALFQAYGTYIVPFGSGLNVDFGKWASSLGIEGNYTKDQMNYSRSFWFDFLPFYHMGVRANYKINDVIAANFWLINGTDQTEAFNNYKDQLYGLVVTPNKNVTWTLNYYLGQEHPDTVYYPNGGAPPGAPAIQSVPFEPIPDAPKGHLDIVDSYINWQASPKLTLALEADDVISRLYQSSAPNRAWGGATYAQYNFTPKLALASRAEYLSDRGQLFTGVGQALKETTVTIDYRIADGFLTKLEWRRDFSNQPYFYTSVLGNLKKEQNTAAMGVVWWFGPKTGAW